VEKPLAHSCSALRAGLIRPGVQVWSAMPLTMWHVPAGGSGTVFGFGSGNGGPMPRVGTAGGSAGGDGSGWGEAGTPGEALGEAMAPGEALGEAATPGEALGEAAGAGDGPGLGEAVAAREELGEAAAGTPGPMHAHTSSIATPTTMRQRLLCCMLPGLRLRPRVTGGSVP
jgi:hypothetical protein